MNFSIDDRICFNALLGTYTVLKVDLENGVIETEFGVESFGDFFDRDPILAEGQPRPVPRPEIGGTRDRRSLNTMYDSTEPPCSSHSIFLGVDGQPNRRARRWMGNAFRSGATA